MTDRTEYSEGQLAYEEDVRGRPCYPGGEPRPQWADVHAHTKTLWQKESQARKATS